MGRRNRIILGRYEDARTCAAKRAAGINWGRNVSRHNWTREIHDVVEVVRYHLGNTYARVAYAHLCHRNWRKTRLKKSTFYKMLKKVKILLRRVNIGQKQHSNRQ